MRSSLLHELELGADLLSFLHSFFQVEAKTKEIETETHLRSLADRETVRTHGTQYPLNMPTLPTGGAPVDCLPLIYRYLPFINLYHLVYLHSKGRLHKDLDKLAVERSELQDKVTVLQNSIYKATEQMDQFKLLMNWNQVGAPEPFFRPARPVLTSHRDPYLRLLLYLTLAVTLAAQEEIEQWALAQRQKEEDNAALEKYRHQDAAKAKELLMAQEKVSKAVVQKKEDLEAEVMETQAAQIQLDKAAEDFRCGACVCCGWV